MLRSLSKLISLPSWIDKAPKLLIIGWFNEFLSEKIENSISEVLSNQILDLSKDYVLEKERVEYIKNIFGKNIIFRWYYFLKDKSYRDSLSIFKKIIFREKQKNHENI